MSYTIYFRNRTVIITDPQRRVYDGCIHSYELGWTPWESIESGISPEAIEKRLKFWRELNDYAVSQRGKEAESEYRAEVVE